MDKPEGWTSHDVVAKVRNILSKQADRKIRVGHAGTLDPLATGLLLLLTGNYTKKAGEFSKLDKTYQAKAKLGETSTTGDREGEKTQVNTKKPTVKTVKSVLASFIGESMQTPPAYSAVKVKGQRAYKLARQGKEVSLKQRRITIYDISEINYKYPHISFMVKVSSGTYIRSLAGDIGEKLGTGAYLESLKRTQINGFFLKNAVKPEEASVKNLLTSI